MKKQGYKLGILLILTFLVLTGATACNPFAGEEGVSQQLVEVLRGDLTVSVSGSGNIEIPDELNLTFGVDGRIEKINVEEGDEVTKGEVLARLDIDALELARTEAQVALTEAQVALTEAQLPAAEAKVAIEEAEYNLNVYDKRHFPLKQQRIAELQLEVSELQLEVAGLQLEVAEQAVEQAQQSLEYTQKQLDKATLIAPFDGIAASVSADEGDTVSTTTPIVHLVDPTAMELKVEVDELDILGVKLGQRAIVSIDALSGVELGGKVTFIPPLSREEPGLVLYDVKISFDIPQDLVLRGGMSATADIVIDEGSNILLVPNQAITLDNQGNPVVLVMVDEQTEERKVATGISDSSHTEILRGLDEGEVVVVIIER